MSKEMTRLEEMRHNNKITESDYQILAKALRKKSIFENIEDSFLLNPFIKVAGLKALIIGILLLLLLMSWIGAKIQVYFDGVLGYFIPYGLKAMKPNFWLLIYQNSVACLTLSLMFLLTAIFFRQKNLRIIDFFGTVALARFPTFIALISTGVEKILNPELFSNDISQGIELHFSFGGAIFNFIIFFCLAWQVLTYFFAFQESSGLVGKKLLIVFTILLMISDSIAMPLTRLFLYGGA